MRPRSLAFSLIPLIISCSGGPAPVLPTAPDPQAHADSVSQAMAEFVEKLGKPESWEWRASVDEQHQSFPEYVKSRPVKPDRQRNKIYIQPIGEFDSLRQGIISTAVKYLHDFFGLEVKLNRPLSSSIIPGDAERMNNGARQVHTQYILKNIMIPTLPADAAAFIAFTTVDLYPRPEWNFVFGQASTRERVGVWSLARYGDPYKSKDDLLICTVRTLKTASHEAGHMFSIPHCVNNRCNMNGSNSLEESNKKPLWFCPECLCKLSYALDISEETHLENMLGFWKEQKEPRMIEVYDRMLKAIQKK